MTAARPAGGVFVTFEGGDGGGKTTQLRRLAADLRAAGREVVETREPGGAPGAEEIRSLVLEGAAGRWSPVTELLLFNAARRDHLERTVLPALARGAAVLCDRFADSTRVYQSCARDADAPDHSRARGADAPDQSSARDVDAPDQSSARDAGAPGAAPQMVEALHALVIGMEPDLTLILDLDPELALARGLARGGDETRFERLGLGFHTRIRDGFRALAAAHPARCRLIDARGEPDEVAARVRAAAAARLPELAGTGAPRAGDATGARRAGAGTGAPHAGDATGARRAEAGTGARCAGDGTGARRAGDDA
jgi:dTMP kinase